MSLQPISLVSPMLVAVVFAAAAAWIDARERRIPNGLVLAGVAVAFVSQIALNGFAGGSAALAGLAVGTAVMVPFYVIGAMGAGDVKLMAMVGVGLGPLGALSAAVSTFVIGALLALAVAVARGTLASMLSNVRAMLFGAFASVVIQRKAEVTAPAVSAGRLPYGIAIALGTATHAALTQAGIRIL